MNIFAVFSSACGSVVFNSLGNADGIVGEGGGIKGGGWTVRGAEFSTGPAGDGEGDVGGNFVGVNDGGIPAS